MSQRTALIFGSTGLIGNLLLEELILSDNYSGVKIFVRQPIGISAAKVEEFVVDFSNTSRDVAKAMIAILQKEPFKTVYESDELQLIADMN